MYQRSTLKGITLIELLIAMALSLCVLSIIVELYLASEDNYATESALHALQENARLTSELLARQIRMAGFAGCAQINDNFPLQNHTNIPVNAHNKMTFYQTHHMKFNTDAFTVWRASEESDILQEDMQDDTSFLLTKHLTLAPGDALFISDCKTTELFYVKSVEHITNNTQKIITSAPLNKLYAQNAEVIPLEVTSYFIADTGRLDEKQQPIYALYKQNFYHQTVELAQGVNDMRIDCVLREGNKFIQQPWRADIDSNLLQGISLHLTLSSLTRVVLQKNWYLYVALREI